MEKTPSLFGPNPSIGGLDFVKNEHIQEQDRDLGQESVESVVEQPLTATPSGFEQTDDAETSDQLGFEEAQEQPVSELSHQQIGASAVSAVASSEVAPQPQKLYFQELAEPVPRRKPIVTRRWNKRSSWAFLREWPWLNIVTSIMVMLVCVGVGLLFWQKITQAPPKSLEAVKVEVQPVEVLTQPVEVEVRPVEAVVRSVVETKPARVIEPWISPVETELLPESAMREESPIFASLDQDGERVSLVSNASSLKSLQKYAFFDVLLDEEAMEAQRWLSAQEVESVTPSSDMGEGYFDLIGSSGLFLVQTKKVGGLEKLNLDALESVRVVKEHSFFQAEIGKLSGVVTFHGVFEKAHDAPNNKNLSWLYLSAHPEEEGHLVACATNLATYFEKTHPAIVSLKWVEEGGVDYPKVIAIEQLGW